MTQHYLAGELSLLLSQLQTVTNSGAAARDVACLRYEAETAPLPALPSVTVRALQLTDCLCWDSLTRADTATCPIVASYGGRDRALRGAATRLERVLTAVGVEHDVKEYPEGGHGFINDHDGAGDKTPLLFAVLGKLSPGAAYHEPSARDARTRIIAFLDPHLKT